MEGVSCNPAEGALYAMPRLHLPKKACEVRIATVPCQVPLLALVAMEWGLPWVPWGCGWHYRGHAACAACVPVPSVLHV